MLFFDTCALLEAKDLNQYTPFMISSTTYAELENIKTSRFKDEEVKYKARQVVNFLKQNPISRTIKYTIDDDFYEFRKNHAPYLPDNNDARILYDAYRSKKEHDITFVTEDGLCQEFALMLGMDVQEVDKTDNSYTGYSIVKTNTEEELANIYATIFSNPKELDIVENQYLLIKHQSKIQDDCYKYRGGKFIEVNYPVFKSKHFGMVKPRDPFQKCLMDSMRSNKLTLAGGVAGAGKSYLSLGYLFQQLENGKIDTIVIFCNTVATDGSAKLGYYPGSRDEKLLDSQIGNFLASKLGDRFEVEKLVDEGSLILLPMSDIRGFDTTGMNAGVYITEAQNLNIDLMQLALQRIGEDSFCILDGDKKAQVDLSMYEGSNNGMRRVSEVFKGENIFGQVDLPITHRSKIANIAARMKDV